MFLNFQFAAVLTIFFLCTTVTAQKYGSSEGVVVVKEWNGIPFSSEKSLYENISQSPELSKVSTMLKEFESEIFTDEFNGTVFVTLDSAYNTMSEEEIESLFTDRIGLKKFFNYYIVPGRLDTYAIKKAIEKNGGVARLKTLNGVDLNVKIENDELLLFDFQKKSARVIASDFYHKNGFFHLVEGLVFP